MQHPVPLALLLLALVGGAAAAQTTVNPGARDQVSPRRPVAHPAPHPAPPPPMPVVPLAPPPPPVIPPPIVVPVRPMPPPLPAVIVADAAGVATPIPNGLRLTFGAGSADLNPASAAALRALAHAAPADGDFNVSAYAAGMPDDPSTPRRLSLSRALAVRSVLIGEGIVSTRIYPRALGASAPDFADGPPDRADIVVVSPPPQPTPPPVKPAP